MNRQAVSLPHSRCDEGPWHFAMSVRVAGKFGADNEEHHLQIEYHSCGYWSEDVYAVQNADDKRTAKSLQEGADLLPRGAWYGYSQGRGI